VRNGTHETNARWPGTGDFGSERRYRPCRRRLRHRDFRRPGVPIIINGIDASYAVIEGEWGLGRGEQVSHDLWCRSSISAPRSATTIRAPVVCRVRASRDRTAANRKPARRAEPFHQSWSAQSAPPAAPDRGTLLSAADNLRAPRRRFRQAATIYRVVARHSWPGHPESFALNPSQQEHIDRRE